MNLAGVEVELKTSTSGNKMIINISWNEHNELLGKLLEARLPDALRQELVSEGYSSRFINSVINSLSISTTPKSAIVSVTHPFFAFIEFGVRPRVMKQLLGKVVPIKTAGQIIFRKVTEKSILRGKWRHPGTYGKGLLRTAVVSSLTEAIQLSRIIGPGMAGGIVRWLAKAIQNLSRSMSK